MKEDYKMDTTKLWDYRVVRKESDDGLDERYSIQEVYYDEDGIPTAQTMDLMVEQDTITGMRTQLENMLKALGEPVLDESDIVDKSTNDIDYYTGPDGHYKKSMEERVLDLEIENTKMRERLTKLSDELINKSDVTDKDVEQWKKDVLKRGGI